MRCKGCQRQLKKNERQYKEYDETDGMPPYKLVGLWHLKCWHTHLKRQRWEKQGRARETVTPYDVVRLTRNDVEQQAALEARQAELAAEREKEESPRRFDDWRE